MIAIDLPGHGKTPVRPGADTFAYMADAVDEFLAENELRGCDAVGSSMGARILLELARRGSIGATVALDPGGFWQGWERSFIATSLGASIRLVRAIQPALPFLTGMPPVGRLCWRSSPLTRGACLQTSC